MGGDGGVDDTAREGSDGMDKEESGGVGLQEAAASGDSSMAMVSSHSTRSHDLHQEKL